MPSQGTTCCTCGPSPSRTSGASGPKSFMGSSALVLSIISVSQEYTTCNRALEPEAVVFLLLVLMPLGCSAGIRQLQLMLLKMALLLGIEIHVNVEFKGLIEPPEDQESESKCAPGRAERRVSPCLAMN